MKMIWRWLPLLFLLIPASALSTDIQYALDVQIDPATRKLSGSARISTDTDADLSLAIGNLHNVRQNGKEIVRNLNDVLVLRLRKNQATVVTYEAGPGYADPTFMDADHVFLAGNWYPQPAALATYQLVVRLPETFAAVSEADSIRSKSDGGTVTYRFHFDHPLDQLHLAASTRYVVAKDRYQDIELETYFFEEDAALASTYLEHAKKYLQMYEEMLTPYPYKRFAMVAHRLPTGLSMPTFTLLGQGVVRLPFIVKTSLGHELLHQWFGNSVYTDLSQGNWSEGLTAYLSDQELAVLDHRGIQYRKQIMVDYDAYVRSKHSLSLDQFYYRSNKAESVVGYGASAMLFHELRKRFGDGYFFDGLRDFIQRNQYTRSSWSHIQSSFERTTGQDLSLYFDRRLQAADIPDIQVEAAEIVSDKGELHIQFKLSQASPPRPLTLPVSIYFEKEARIHFIAMAGAEKTVRLPVHDLPTRVVLDEGYDVMRHLKADEIPPVLAHIMSSDRLTVVVPNEDREVYQPLIDALEIEAVTFLPPEQLSRSTLKDGTFLLAGYDSHFLKTIAGSMGIPDEGVHLKVIENPYDPSLKVLLAHVKEAQEARVLRKKLRHYGKYTELAFSGGRVSLQRTDAAQNGISVWRHAPTKAVMPEELPTLDRIIPVLASHKIVYIGERHDRYAHHINQLLIIKKLHERGLKLTVGMEMFKKPFQPVIDDYLAGRIDERRFLKDVSYFSEWGYNYHLYKPIVDYLKEHGIPLVALNLNDDISRQVARNGIAALEDEDRESLPQSIDITNDQYREDLKQVFNFHGSQDELDEFDYFLQAQVLWDESMAETADAYLRTAPDRTLVVLAGNGHFRYKYGIPQRLYRRNQEPYVVVLQDEELKSGLGDYLLFTEKLSERTSPKLGVTIKQKDNGLKVQSVVDDSPAARAGLEKGDLIQAFDGFPITSLNDLKLALFYAELGRAYELDIKRDDDKIRLKISLFISSNPHP